MYKLLFVLFIFTNINTCFAIEYSNQDLGIRMSIPEGAQVVEGNALKEFSEEEFEAFKKVFETEPSQIQETLNQTIFTIGYYDGQIPEGPNGSIMVSAVPAISKGVEEFSSALCGSEEKETELMSFKFYEKDTSIEISGHKFVVSKGNLKIIQDKVVIFEMPIYYYITEIASKYVTFIISGESARVAKLEGSLLEMVVNEKL